MKTLKFKNGNEAPVLGFGTWKLEGKECEVSVKQALEIGYRHIDTADKYGNHEFVGKALRSSGINRKEIFLTTKVWHSELKGGDVRKSALRFLEELQTDYLDLLLIHWPNRDVHIKETLDAMNQLKIEGIIKNIGVSNFTKRHLKDLLEFEIEVVNNQVELHPTFAQFDLAEFCKEQEIILTAYSPLGRGEDLQIPELIEIAEKYGKSVPQVIINWIVSRGIITIPKGTSKEHIQENFEALDFELSSEDIEAINKLDKGERLIKPEWNEFEG